MIKLYFAINLFIFLFSKQHLEIVTWNLSCVRASENLNNTWRNTEKKKKN